MKGEADMLFEVSWETTNKCGGIYTVISSKAKLMTEIYDEYFSVGPLFDKLPIDFTQENIPSNFEPIINELSEEGIKCIYGLWNIPGAPKTFLIDGRRLNSQLDKIKTSLWEKYGIDSLTCSHDFNEPLIWSWAVGIFLEKVGNVFPNKKIVGHFHEWLSGFSLLHLKNVNSSVKSVFTTHATMLGRTIASNGENLYDSLNQINPEKKSKEMNISEKFTTEKACALNSDVFTTVSNITANECNAFFGRMPQILPNGLLIDDEFPNFEEASYNHHNLKKKLKNVCKGYFFPYQIFDLDNTMFFYFSGRYEFMTKGLNTLPRALGKLNNYLKLSDSDKTVVMLFLVAMNNTTIKNEVLENKNNFQILKNIIDSTFDKIIDKAINQIMSGNSMSSMNIPKEETILKLFSYKMKKTGLPPLCSHFLPYDENEDNLIKELKRNNLLNRPEDQVKVIMVPYYLDGSDGLFDMSYYDIVNACHLGLFPSYYEPWGYTPLESVAFGVPALTTDEAGFGKFVEDKLPPSHPGIFLCGWQRTNADNADLIFEHMRNYISFDAHARIACKMNAHKLSGTADWKNLIVNYIKAHNDALNNRTKNEKNN